MRAAGICQEYRYDDDRLLADKRHRPDKGKIDLVSPDIGDIPTVANALQDRPSLSIHVYGAHIGAVKRSIYNDQTGQPKTFISGYSNSVIPNIWDRSIEINNKTH